MSRRDRGRQERVQAALDWQAFEHRERWRQALEIWHTLGAAQKLRCKREHPEAYAWLQRNA